mgnify:CR=1 FL=1
MPAYVNEAFVKSPSTVVAAPIAAGLRKPSPAPPRGPITSALCAVVIRRGSNAATPKYAATPPARPRIVSAVALGSLVSIALFYGSSYLAGGSWADGFPRSFWHWRARASRKSWALTIAAGPMYVGWAQKDGQEVVQAAHRMHLVVSS